MINNDLKNERNASLLKFADLVSENDSTVRSNLEMFLRGKAEYFNKFEDDLYQRGIEAPEQIGMEIVLIDALESVGKLVYSDIATEADFVMTEIDVLSNGKISKGECFKKLIVAYKNAGRFNAIGNFVANSNIAPMPFDCISSQGYRLLAIDEGSDSYAFILLKNSLVDIALKYADTAEIKLYFSTTT